MGIVGDSATGSLAHYLMLRRGSRERLVASEAIYDHAFASRQGARAVRRAAVSDGTFCMSYALGFDQRELLPPFVPEGRNADGVFGHVVRQCFRDMYFGLLPEVVAHRPRARGSSMADTLARLEQIDLNDLICRIVGASGIRARSADGARCLRTLGAHLERLGSLAPPDLEEYVRTLVLRTRSRDIAVLRQSLAVHQRQPSYWATDVARLIERMSDVVLEPRHCWPGDLIAVDGEKAGREGLGRVLRDYGRLLQWWPAVDAAARELREAGERLSRSVS